MSSVPPSRALTHRSAHLQLNLCDCSVSMCAELRGQRYYRGDCETGTDIFTGPTFVSMSKSEWGMWWGHLARQQGVPYLLFTRNNGMRTGVSDKKTHIRQVTSWEIINTFQLHNTFNMGNQLLGHQVVFDIPLLSVQKKNTFVHWWLQVIYQHWLVCVTQLIAFLSISKQT